MGPADRQGRVHADEFHGRGLLALDPVHRIESKKATSVKLVGVDAPLPVGRAHKENLKETLS